MDKKGDDFDNVDETETEEAKAQREVNESFLRFEEDRRGTNIRHRAMPYEKPMRTVLTPFEDYYNDNTDQIHSSLDVTIQYLVDLREKIKTSQDYYKDNTDQIPSSLDVTIQYLVDLREKIKTSQDNYLTGSNFMDYCKHSKDEILSSLDAIIQYLEKETSQTSTLHESRESLRSINRLLEAEGVCPSSSIYNNNQLYVNRMDSSQANETTNELSSASSNVFGEKKKFVVVTALDDEFFSKEHTVTVDYFTTNSLSHLGPLDIFKDDLICVALTENLTRFTVYSHSYKNILRIGKDWRRWPGKKARIICRCATDEVYSMPTDEMSEVFSEKTNTLTTKDVLKSLFSISPFILSTKAKKLIENRH